MSRLLPVSTPAWAVLAWLTVAPPIGAQSSGAPSGAAQPSAAQPGTVQPGATSPGTPQPGAAAGVPPTPAATGVATPEEIPPVDDPMLEPVPPAEQLLANWEAALARVRAQSPDVRRAYAQIEAARGRARQVLSRSLPTLVGTANGNYHLLTGTGLNIFTGQVSEVPNPRGNFSADATLRIPLFSARNWYDHGTAKEQIVQSELSAEEAERQVLGGLAEAIASVVTAERLSEVTRLNLSSALLSLELSQRRERLGAASRVDVLRAEQEVTLSRSQVVESDETLRQSREALGLALGSNEAWGLTPNIRLDRLGEDARKVCKPTNSVSERADLRALAAAEKVAERNVKSVDYSFLPTLAGQTTFAYNTNQLQAATRDHLTWTIGAVLTWNLYDGGLRYGEKQSAAAARETAHLDSVDAKRRADVEVTRAFRSVTVAESQLAIAHTAGEVASQNARIAQLRFLNGTGTSFDMTETQAAARRASLDVTVKEFQLLRSRITAFLAMASCHI